VLQCGADAVEEDPLSRLSLSNNAHWEVLRGLMSLGCPRLLVLGGGGYNPWSVGRLWTGVWATLNGHEIPDRLPQEGEDGAARAALGPRPRGPQPARALVHHPARQAAPGSGAARRSATASTR
jgi:acetoin utilization protein AcuC